MGDNERVIQILDKIRDAIIELQSNFSRVIDIYYSGKSVKSNKIPRMACANSQISAEHYKALKTGELIKDIITEAQNKYINAVNLLNSEPVEDLTEEQVKELQREINQATIDIVSYNDMIKCLYEALKIYM